MPCCLYPDSKKGAVLQLHPPGSWVIGFFRRLPVAYAAVRALTAAAAAGGFPSAPVTDQLSHCQYHQSAYKQSHQDCTDISAKPRHPGRLLSAVQYPQASVSAAADFFRIIIAHFP